MDFFTPRLSGVFNRPKSSVSPGVIGMKYRTRPCASTRVDEPKLGLYCNTHNHALPNRVCPSLSPSTCKIFRPGQRPMRGNPPHIIKSGFTLLVHQKKAIPHEAGWFFRQISPPRLNQFLSGKRGGARLLFKVGVRLVPLVCGGDQTPQGFQKVYRGCFILFRLIAKSFFLR